ncbi:MAG: hypothetical protein RBG13Loki_2194 [Promethearchaeota archaeon CR_4]|nr:MAG: hypothetical protein RBG13Loki_2194 [Candidatus Lokiarchaeota archaeon CR_4]
MMSSWWQRKTPTTGTASTRKLCNDQRSVKFSPIPNGIRVLLQRNNRLLQLYLKYIFILSWD